MKEKKCFKDLEIGDIILTKYNNNDSNADIVSRVLRFENNSDGVEEIMLCDIYMVRNNIKEGPEDEYMADSYNVSLNESADEKVTEFVRFLYNSKNEIDTLKEKCPEYFI